MTKPKTDKPKQQWKMWALINSSDKTLHDIYEKEIHAQIWKDHKYALDKTKCTIKKVLVTVL